MNTPPVSAILLVALSARPYVQALKQAGYYTVVIDGFLDQETRFFADEAYQVDFDDLGFNVEAFKALLSQVVCKQRQPWLGCVYGAGVEARPSLLAGIEMYLPILGNVPEVLERTNAPDAFFAVCEANGINFPPWQLKPQKIQHDDHWLKKRIGGAGGHHIEFAKPMDEANDAVYFQQVLQGEPISVLFLSLPSHLGGDNNALILGVHTQWAAATDTAPFRLGGLVVLDQLSNKVEQALKKIVQNLTSACGLIGLNTLDVIVMGDDVFVLELNPRLSLSLDMYLQDYIRHAQVNLVALHVSVCLFLLEQDSKQKKQIIHAITKVMAYHKALDSARLINAIAVVYAPASFDLKEDVLWPDWVVDRPALAGRIEQNSPVCSVRATAQTTALAKQKVLERVAAIKQNAELISSN